MMKFSLSAGALSAILGCATLLATSQTVLSQTAPAQEGKVETPKEIKAPEAAQQTFEAMMGAIEDNNRAAFLAFADTRFKAALTPQFQSVVDQLAPRLRGGHTLKYLGEMNQAGFTVYLWRVRFEDGGDDSLAQMSIKDEKVGGFFLH